MGVIQVNAERTVSAPADQVFGYIRDMNVHPKFLPPAFSDFQVESGGVGTGWVTFKLTAAARHPHHPRPICQDSAPLVSLM